MGLIVMTKVDLSKWIDRLNADYRIIGPKSVRGQHVFDEIHSISEVDLDYATSVLPPKKALFPQREDIMVFDTRINHFDPVFDDQPTILLGVHTCDLHAIILLDQVFYSGHVDQHYLRRRMNTFLVSIECLEPCTEHAFCKDMGTYSIPDEFDLHMTDLGDAYAIDVGSEKGSNLLDGFENIHEPSDQERSLLNRVISGKWARFHYRLDADVTELPSLLKVNYKSRIWEELSKRCLGCGMCTLVCPTCYCFNVLDEVDFSLSSGRRYRVWDSCQLNQFATVAGGHDFRPGAANRQRHRFLRKYRYQSISPGLLGCVGCGRCAQTCLVDISPVNVINKLYQDWIVATRNREEASIK